MEGYLSQEMQITKLSDKNLHEKMYMSNIDAKTRTNKQHFLVHLSNYPNGQLSSRGFSHQSMNVSC